MTLRVAVFGLIAAVIGASAEDAPPPMVQPKRSADFTARLTYYQPRPKGWERSTNTPEWIDRRTGGPNMDSKGKDTLKFGVLAANLGARNRYKGFWRYGQRVYLGEPFNREFVLLDSFGGWQARHRLDVCCIKASTMRKWRKHTRVKCWVIKRN